MPKFIVTILIITLTSWATWVFVLLKIPPLSLKSFLAFFVSLFLAIAGSVAIVTFTFEKGTKKNVTNLRQIFRNCLRRGGMASSFVVGAGVMKVEGIFNWVNVILFASLLILIEYYLSTREQTATTEQEEA